MSKKSERTYRPWTGPERKRFAQIYPTVTRKQLMEAFPLRTWQSLMNAASQMKLHKVRSPRRPNHWKQIADAHVYTFTDFKPQAGETRHQLAAKSAPKQTLGPV